MAGNDECGMHYHHGRGDERTRHVCHRRPRHRGRHHSDDGLHWGGLPYHAAAKLTSQPCPDCKRSGPTKKGNR